MWLSGLTKSSDAWLVVRAWPDWAEVEVQQTESASLLSQGHPAPGSGKVADVWGWETTRKGGHQTSRSLLLNVVEKRDVYLQVVGGERRASSAGESAGEVLGKARLILDVDLQGGAGGHLCLPLVLDGRVCGTLSLFVNLSSDEVLTGEWVPRAALQEKLREQSGGGGGSQQGRSSDPRGGDALSRHGGPEPLPALGGGEGGEGGGGGGTEEYWSPRGLCSTGPGRSLSPSPASEAAALPRKPWASGDGRGRGR